MAFVLFAVGVAAANNLLNAPSVGLGLNGTSTANGTTTAQASTPTTTSPAPSTNGVPATMTTSPTPTTTPAVTTPGATSTGATTVEQIVSITRTVDAGTTAVSAFTVPAGRLLVVTDALITNTGTTPMCGASISPDGTGTSTTFGAVTAATPPTAATATTGTVSATPTATVTPAAGTGESGTGVLCVPAQTSLSVGLTTGLEFAAGQSVLLANASTTAGATTPVTTGPLNFHLRGLLVIPGV